MCELSDYRYELLEECAPKHQSGRNDAYRVTNALVEALNARALLRTLLRFGNLDREDPSVPTMTVKISRLSMLHDVKQSDT